MNINKMTVLSKPLNTKFAEKELFVEILRGFRNILFGHKLIVHTDHKNLLYRGLPTERISWWRMLLEEYDVEYHHVKGTNSELVRVSK